MKRFLKVTGFALVMTCLLGTAAWAAVDINGAVYFDAYYYHQDKEGFARPGWTTSSLQTTPGSGGLGGIPVGATAAAEDRNQTFFDLNHSTHLRFHWTNTEGSLGAVLSIYMNGDPAQSSSTDAGFKVGTSVAYLYYNINKNLRLQAGKGGADSVWSPLSPSTLMGYDGVAKVTGLGYGNVSGTYANNVRLTYRVNNNVTLNFSLSDPRMTADEDAGFGRVTGTTVENVTKIPKLEFSAPLTFRKAGLRVIPSFFYLKSEFSNVEDGGEDSIVSYGASLGASFERAGLKLRAEYNYGQNFWNAARSGIYTNYPFKYEYIAGGLRGVTAAKYSTIDKKVYDSKTQAFWMQAGYTMGIVTPTLFYGRNDSERDMPSGALGQGDAEFTTQMYGINVPIAIKKNFFIVPEFMVYDNGDDNKIVSSSATSPSIYDFGKEWLAGVQFRLFF